MRKHTLLIAMLFTAVGITMGFSINATAQEPTIPAWIKDTARWWADGQVSDTEFIKALQWLVNQGILQVPQSDQSQQTTQLQQSSTQQEIPVNPISRIPVQGKVLFYFVNDMRIFDQNSTLQLKQTQSWKYLQIELTISNSAGGPVEITQDSLLGTDLVDLTTNREYYPMMVSKIIETQSQYVEAGMDGHAILIYLIPEGHTDQYSLVVGLEGPLRNIPLGLIKI